MTTAVTLMGVGVLVAGLVLVASPGGQASPKAKSVHPAVVPVGTKVADFGLFDETNPGAHSDNLGTCQGTGFFNFHVAARAIDGNATLRVNFNPSDGDFIDYPIPDGTSFSLDQSAGTSTGVDDFLQLSHASGSGKLVGWFGAERIAGPGNNRKRVRCDSGPVDKPLSRPHAATTVAKIADFGLFDETNPAHDPNNLGFCLSKTNTGFPDDSGHSRWLFHASVRAIDGNATLRVLFEDTSGTPNDQVDYPIPDGTSFSLTMPAGDSAGTDTQLQLVHGGGSGRLVGWFSAERIAGRPNNGARVECTSGP